MNLSYHTQVARFPELACSGKFGFGNSPLAPDGSRRLFLEQPFWQTKYTTNTEAYVVNTKRLDHILKVISPNISWGRPIDVVYADAMRRGDLKGYMPTMAFCTQGREKTIDEPFPWIGFLMAHYTDGKRNGISHYSELLLPGCKY